MSRIENLSRRGFLKGSLFGVSLILGCSSGSDEKATAPLPSFVPNAFLEIDAADQVTLWATRPEMGQGVHTSLPMIVAEELEVEWSAVAFKRAPFDARYGGQDVAGSSSVRFSFMPLRQAGAAAREMLIAAAAAAFGAPAEECRAEKGAVIHTPTSRSLRYGELVEAASKLPVPSEPRLKDPSEFRLIGTRVKRVDAPAKVDGSAGFGIDTRIPGMLHATVLHCPVFGGTLASVDDAAARKVPGVRHVEKLKAAVAVVADTTWAAMKGRDALTVTWDEGAAATATSAQMREALKAAVTRPAAVAHAEGDAEAALAGAATTLSAAYEVPYLAHAAMEPVNCAADVRADACEVWAPGQFPSVMHVLAAKIAGLPPEAVKVNMTFLGGGFGRRSEQDFLIEAVTLSKAVGAPVKVTWSREEDTKQDFYRAASYHELRAGLDDQGGLAAWTHRVVAPSIFGQRGIPIENNLDPQAVEGAAELPYTIPAVLVDYVMENGVVPVGFWRSVYNSQNAFANECFVDEIAVAAGKDPVELRREILAGSPRLKAVLDLAAEKAGWGSALPAGRGRGVAVHHSFETYVAQVAEVTVSPEGVVKVDRIVCAVDCGIAINPDTIEAQIEGAIVYGLSAALKEEITIDKGRVVESNFYDYDVLRMGEMPVIEVHLVQSGEAPGGIGEPGLPPTAPAVANAVFAATGKRIRRLPIRADELTQP
jgi:isoquinoline 1-oxidoreductase subunit beta